MVHDNGSQLPAGTAPAECSVRPAASESTDGHEHALARILLCLADSGQAVERLTRQVAALTEQIEQTRAQDRLLEELQQQNREMRESFYEREVLGTIINGLIANADRVWKHVQELRRATGRLTAASSINLHGAGGLLRARHADLVEVQSLLATFGVESYQRCGHTFDPETQKCVQQVDCHQPDRHSQVVRRLLPGYRRGKSVVRHECVAVFVYKARNQGE